MSNNQKLDHVVLFLKEFSQLLFSVIKLGINVFTLLRGKYPEADRRIRTLSCDKTQCCVAVVCGIALYSATMAKSGVCARARFSVSVYAEWWRLLVLQINT